MAVQEFVYPEDISIPDDFPEKDYAKSKVKPTIEQTGKFGQLKLFVTELFFLCNYWDPVKIPNLTVLYIGAGPGHHLVTLTKMFPTVTWELYDLQTFAPGLESQQNVKLFERYFEDSDIPRYAGRTDVFLICDIRNLTYKQGDVKWSWANEKKVIEDMQLQESWVLNMKPIFSSLKFRLPYAEKEVIENLGNTWKYLDGTVYIQPWVGETSSETRLIVDGANLKIRAWYFPKFEKQMFYHNKIRRLQRYKSNYIVNYDSRTTSLSSQADKVRKSPKQTTDFVLSDYYDSVVTMETLAHYLRRTYGPSKSKNPELLERLVKSLILPITNIDDSEEQD